MTMINPDHLHTTTLGREAGLPVHVTLLRCRLFERRFTSREVAESPAGAVLWWDELVGDGLEDTVRTVALPTADPVDLRAWNERIPGPPGWSLVEPGTRFGIDVHWFTGHLATKITTCDGYADDLSTLCCIVTAAGTQRQNLADGRTEAFALPLPSA